MEKFIFNGDWETTIRLEEFAKLNNPKLIVANKEANLYIYDNFNENPDPEQAQLNTLNFLTSIEGQKNIINSIFKYIKNVIYPEYQNYISIEEYPECFPPLNQVSDLYNVIALTDIFVFDDNENVFASYAFYFETCLDQEHGLVLLMEKSEVVEYNEIPNMAFGTPTWRFQLEDFSSFNEVHLYQPHTKYGKLKPFQQYINENYAVILYLRGQINRFFQEIDLGTTPYEPHISNLFTYAIYQENEELITLAREKRPTMLENSFEAAFNRNRFDLADRIIELGYEINEKKGLDSLFYTQIWELYQVLNDKEAIEVIIKKLEYLIKRRLNPFLKDENGNDAFCIYDSIYNWDEKKRIKEIINEVLRLRVVDTRARN